MIITSELKKQLQEKMGSWYPVLEEYLKTEGFDDIMRQLKACTASGKKVAPLSGDLWNAFKYCPRDKFRVLMLGYCPYHTFKEGKPIADGIMFSNSYNKPGEQQQPSLQTFYDGMTDDLGFNPLNPNRNDLRYLSKQGVLMLNAQLTVEENKAGSHIFWDPFTKWFIENVLNKHTRGIICIFYGTVVGKYEKMINPLQHYTKVVEHPAAVSYRKGEVSWKHGKLFSYIDQLLWDNNKEIIDWTDNGLQGLPF